MRFLTISLLLYLCKYTTAVGEPSQPPAIDFEKTYHVDFTTDEDGGCKSQEAKVRTAWGEVVSLLQASVESLEDLQRPMTHDPDPLGVNEWKRKADTFFTLFGNQIPTNGWTFGGNIPTQVWRTYKKYINDHNVVGPNPARIYWLKCTDNWLQYLGPNDKDPTDPAGNRKISDNQEAVAVAQGNAKNGIYYAKSAPDGITWFWPRGVRPNAAEPLCETEPHARTSVLTDAVSGARTRIITFCPPMFAITDWRVTGGGVPIKSGDDIDDKLGAIAVTWIHEMGHYIQPWFDPVVNLRKSKLSFLGKKDKTDKVYGWLNSVLYAQQQPALVAQSPENYAIFAATMTWSNFWWITGKAQAVADVINQAQGAK